MSSASPTTRSTRPRPPGATRSCWRVDRNGHCTEPADNLTGMPEFPTTQEPAVHTDERRLAGPAQVPAHDDVRGRRAVKAVIPAAGLATRFLPATKAVPKEL